MIDSIITTLSLLGIGIAVFACIFGIVIIISAIFVIIVFLSGGKVERGGTWRGGQF